MSVPRGLVGAGVFNESWNGWFMVLSGRSALWTTPGPTAFRTMVDWAILATLRTTIKAKVVVAAAPYAAAIAIDLLAAVLGMRY